MSANHKELISEPIHMTRIQHFFWYYHIRSRSFQSVAYSETDWNESRKSWKCTWKFFSWEMVQHWCSGHPSAWFWRSRQQHQVLHNWKQKFKFFIILLKLFLIATVIHKLYNSFFVLQLITCECSSCQRWRVELCQGQICQLLQQQMMTQNLLHIPGLTQQPGYKAK